MIERLLLRFFGSILGDSEHPDQVNDKKLGMAIAGGTFTAYMLITMPNDWAMWAAYMGSVGGWNVGSYAIKKMASKP